MAAETIGPFPSQELLHNELRARGISLPEAREVVARRVEADGYVDEENTDCWIGMHADPDLAILVIGVPMPQTDRVFPGHLPFKAVLEFEKQWSWPIWTDYSYLCFTLPSDLLRAASWSSQQEAFDLLEKSTYAIEYKFSVKMEGLAKMTEAKLELRDSVPVRDAAILLAGYVNSAGYLGRSQ
ncbi:hypothetical protein [Rhizorhabdus sp.]|uniref:hypothetical protein n=1 Tax=Rhizorhabdus sp. TaxID=1968843 RepID=UPI001984EF7B|nr:hypothetical protein [Rhizorhabdus sp.]MBD3761925.1 hypothetical protein [Rhizorhabdus sp.]